MKPGRFWRGKNYGTENKNHPMKSYHKAGEDVQDRVTALITKYHPDLLAANVRIDLVFVEDDSDDENKPALTLHGYACLGVVRKLPVKDRAMGRGDAEIVLDEKRYRKELEAAERDALLDHELYHLVVVKDGTTPKIDAVGRPVLKIRKHDRQFGWFDEIARRHGKNSNEVFQAQQLMDQAGQTYFNFAKKTAAKAA